MKLSALIYRSLMYIICIYVRLGWAKARCSTVGTTSRSRQKKGTPTTARASHRNAVFAKTYLYVRWRSWAFYSYFKVAVQVCDHEITRYFKAYLIQTRRTDGNKLYIK